MSARKIDLSVIPENCDFRCPYSDFPPAETAGICRTMSAVYCRLLKELVNKNTPCAWRATQAKTRTKRHATLAAKRTKAKSGSRSRRSAS